MNLYHFIRQGSLLVLMLITTLTLESQELEPRALTNVPQGMHFVAGAYGYSFGNILIDPSVPVEDFQANLHTFVAAYVRPISLFGNSGKINVVMPFAHGTWKGVLSGEDTSTVRTGMGDMRVRLSMNFIGAPALSLQDYANYEQKTIVGANIQFIIPAGQYVSNRIVNLGSNRWTFRPQIGLSHRVNKWYFEVYLGAWFFTKNPDFNGGQVVRQKPLLTWKVHVIHALPKQFWISFDAGYGIGGRSTVDDILKDNRISSFRLGANLAIPLGRTHSLKVSAQSAIRLEKGPDFDAFVLAYQYRWRGKM